MIDNKYKCQRAIWRKFSVLQKRLYNDMRDTVAKGICLPPGLRKTLTEEQQNTINHNMACEAAWTVQPLIHEYIEPIV
jgi:hypothetical protein